MIRHVIGVTLFTARGSVRQPLLYVLLLVTPLSYFIVLGLLGGRSLGREALLGAIVALGANAGIISLPQVVLGLRARKLQEMFVASPVSPVSYGLGIAISRLLYVVAPLLAVLVLIALLGDLSIWQTLLVAPLALTGWLVGSAFGYAVALNWSNPMTVSSMSNMAGLLMTVLPPVYYPLGLLPASLRLPALLVPTANVAELVRIALGLAPADGWQIFVQLLLLVAFLAVMAGLAARNLQWEVS